MLVSTSTEKLTELERSFSNRSSLLEVALVVLLGAACLMNWREYQTKSKQTS